MRLNFNNTFFNFRFGLFFINSCKLSSLKHLQLPVNKLLSLSLIQYLVKERWQTVNLHMVIFFFSSTNILKPKSLQKLSVRCLDPSQELTRLVFFSVILLLLQALHLLEICFKTHKVMLRCHRAQGCFFFLCILKMPFMLFFSTRPFWFLPIKSFQSFFPTFVLWRRFREKKKKNYVTCLCRQTLSGTISGRRQMSTNKITVNIQTWRDSFHQ